MLAPPNEGRGSTRTTTSFSSKLPRQLATRRAPPPPFVGTKKNRRARGRVVPSELLRTTTWAIGHMRGGGGRVRAGGWECGLSEKRYRAHAARRAGGQLGGLPAGRAARAGSCASELQGGRGDRVGHAHPARSARASLPRLDRAPSGEVASGRLIVIIDHRQSIRHRQHRSIDHPRSTTDSRAPSTPDHNRSSMACHR